jgi:basic membrane protein A
VAVAKNQPQKKRTTAADTTDTTEEVAEEEMEETAVDCASTTGETEQEGSFQIPTAIEGCYNVGFVYVGPHDDGGWSQAHDVGRQYVQENVENVHTAYVENVPEGADAEQVIRSLARKGFNVIFTTSFGFMDASEIVASEFPDVDIIHISGFKSNGDNFGNLMGAMENMKYLAGMLAGSRAKMDGNPRLGYIATFPIPEELRWVTPLAWVPSKPAPNAPSTCAGSSPGTTPSLSKMPLPPCSTAACRWS